MDHVSEGVAEHLYFDVPRVFDISFDVKPAIAEVPLPLTARLRNRVLQGSEVAYDPHALAATARRWFHQQRNSNSSRPECECRWIIFFDRRRCDRKTVPLNEVVGPDFIAHQFYAFRGGPDERNDRLYHGPGELSILGDKSITRMKGVGARLVGSSDGAISR